MCLGVPAQVRSIEDVDGIRSGKVDFGGVSRSICLEFTPEARVGDYVIVHAGFSISTLDEQEAQKTFELLSDLEAAEWREKADWDPGHRPFEAVLIPMKAPPDNHEVPGRIPR